MMKKSFPVLLSLFALLLVPFKVFAVDLTTIQEKVSDYLPYILIGGAVILLISIIGILLGKKKDSKNDTAPIEMAQPASPQVTPLDTTPTMTPAFVEPSAETQPSVNMDNISNNLYTPTPQAVPERPSIQETLEATPQPVPAESAQSSDLQAILQGEATTEPMTPVTDQVMPQEPTPIVEQPAPMVDNTLSPMTEPSPIPPIDTTSNAVPDLQQFVNNQVAEVPPMAAPTMETPVAEPTPAPTDTTTPTQMGTPVSF